MRPRCSSSTSSSVASTARPAAAPRKPSPNSARSATTRRCAAIRSSASTSCSASRIPRRSARNAASAPPRAPATARSWPPACGTPLPNGTGRSPSWHTKPPARPERGEGGAPVRPSATQPGGTCDGRHLLRGLLGGFEDLALPLGALEALARRLDTALRTRALGWVDDAPGRREILVVAHRDIWLAAWEAMRATLEEQGLLHRPGPSLHITLLDTLHDSSPRTLWPLPQDVWQLDRLTRAGLACLVDRLAPPVDRALTAYLHLDLLGQQARRPCRLAAGPYRGSRGWACQVVPSWATPDRVKGARCARVLRMAFGPP